MNRVTSVIAALICIAAGIYLLSTKSITIGSDGGQSWFAVIAHGMGIYFIGKGLFVGSSLWRQEDEVQHLRRLVELAGLQHQRQATPKADEHAGYPHQSSV
jgi:hypothetical protein